MNFRVLKFFLFWLCTGTCYGEIWLTAGLQGVFSADGKKIAFQRACPNGFRLGILDVASRRVSWVTMEGQAAYPAWGHDGTLVYAFSDDRETALSAVRNKSRNGFNLYVWKDGVTRRLTHGRWRDYAPSFSPDGGTVYYSSTEGEVALPGNGAQRGVNIRAVPRDGGASRAVLSFRHPQCAAVQPSVSPDGKWMLWAEISGIRENWGIAVARTANPENACRLTPQTMPAYAPRWLPDGKRIVCTAHRAGDPGWGVYLLDPGSFSMQRLATGRNPAVSPDGAKIVYDRDGSLWCADLAALRASASAERLSNGFVYPSHARKNDVTVSSPACLPASVALPPCTAYADGPFHLVCDAVYTNRIKGVSVLARGVYAESDRAFQIFLHPNGVPEFAMRGQDGRYVGVRGEGPLPKGRRVRLTGVRCGAEIRLYTDGRLTGCRRTDLLAPRTPQRLVIGEGGACRIETVSVGRDWPAAIPRPLTIGDLVREGDVK